MRISVQQTVRRGPNKNRSILAFCSHVAHLDVIRVGSISRIAEFTSVILVSQSHLSSAVVTFLCVEEEKEKGNSTAGEIFTCIDTGLVLRVQHNRNESIF